ncbi:16S rRNA (cytidine(1402)-2'-O)-methyltransferase [Guyparkeria hydrothermalis]|uniref:16S rRNA (cytidine(1402)-2'-O)-methyltransferase n=1 Tax=Guyparkeria TaxID=2035712 RepID=UPI0010AD3AF2|nr:MULTISPECIES: 16S rRNA (cytidine(1402)-2'-O)-methyltransferase [Guyparkeria]MCL7752017.1 16S rRNA (cytidine(1402)-2'-O)-methyltransferase [Guyparkeria hydrothermalis]TKA89279.1 16S rRNA (cytidine(1402)-2'-O)-methyltransferase [Guyparkeria sp. SB14A]
MSSPNAGSRPAGETGGRWVEPGHLYVVATPIGNLADISERAVSVLKGVDFIACEDTRHARVLLDHLGVRRELVALHEHNERGASESIARRLADGQSAALISDAGTPAISDPGEVLVRVLVDAGLPVVPVPGASAVIAALSASGLPARPFWFEGFLPAQDKARRDRLDRLADVEATLVFYEAPHRIVKCVAAAAERLGGDRRAVLARELTKRFEQFAHGSLEALVGELADGDVPARGEFVFMVAPADARAEAPAAEAEALISALIEEGVAPKTIARVVSRTTSLSRNAVYAEVLARRKES